MCKYSTGICSCPVGLWTSSVRVFRSKTFILMRHPTTYEQWRPLPLSWLQWPSTMTSWPKCYSQIRRRSHQWWWWACRPDWWPENNLDLKKTPAGDDIYAQTAEEWAARPQLICLRTNWAALIVTPWLHTWLIGGLEHVFIFTYIGNEPPTRWGQVSPERLLWRTLSFVVLP